MAFAEVSGGRLWYEEAGSGSAVVLLHAGLMDSRMWEPQVPALAERFRTIRFDVRGYGRSDPPTTPFSPVEDLRSLLDALSIDSAALVGCSMGGAIALDFALAYPERVWALMPVAAGLSGFRFRAYDDEQTARAEAAEAAGDLAAGADIWLEVWAPLGSEEPIRTIAHETAKVFALEDYELEPERPAADRLGEIRAPTLVLVGDRDVPAMAAIADKLAAEIPAARKVVLEGADHLPSFRVPAELNRLLLDFLTSPCA